MFSKCRLECKIFLHTFINFFLEKCEFTEKITKSIKYLELLKECTEFFSKRFEQFFLFYKLYIFVKLKKLLQSFEKIQVHSLNNPKNFLLLVIFSETSLFPRKNSEISK